MTAPKHHTLDIYDIDIHLATTQREWATLRRQIPPLAPRPNSLGRTEWLSWTPKGGGIPREHLVFWINTKTIGDDTAQLIDTCAHEAAHAANFILDWTGHTIARADEPHAYLTGWLTRWIWEGATS